MTFNAKSDVFLLAAIFFNDKELILNEKNYDAIAVAVSQKVFCV